MNYSPIVGQIINYHTALLHKLLIAIIVDDPSPMAVTVENLPTVYSERTENRTELMFQSTQYNIR